MIKIKKRYNYLITPSFLMQDLEDIVKYFEGMYPIDTDVLITLKQKGDVYGDLVGKCFRNEDTNNISIHWLVHNHSNLVHACLVLFHELAHAYDLDKGIYPTEQRAEEVSLFLTWRYLISIDEKILGDHPKASIKLARYLLR